MQTGNSFNLPVLISLFFDISQKYLKDETSIKTQIFQTHTSNLFLYTQFAASAGTNPQKKITGDIDDDITQSLVSDYNLSEKQAVNAYFAIKTYRILTDESTVLYQKPWTEVYLLLLSELKLGK
jgi:hypothetical protein